uniref:NPC intracellular cholesterol transporter 2-like protein n=1 Tax=Pardosa astrigera TaxID=317848 RepID=A0AA96Y2Y6_PARAW|nr:NPC intracellular cholesterol transporter 2-like protein [Pardosa astrigera]
MYFAAVLTLLFVSEALALKYTDCGSKSGRIIDVRLTGCEDSDVCELKRGETYTYGLSFESLTDSENVKAHVYGIVGGVTMPYPLPNPNACETEDIECPIENGKVYDFENTFDVRTSYPAMRLDVKWELKDDNNENIVCGIIPVQIV